MCITLTQKGSFPKWSELWLKYNINFFIYMYTIPNYRTIHVEGAGYSWSVLSNLKLKDLRDTTIVQWANSKI